MLACVFGGILPASTLFWQPDPSNGSWEATAVLALPRSCFRLQLRNKAIDGHKISRDKISRDT